MHFEINADDPLRAKKFYEEVFGWKIEKWEGPVDYWNIETGEEEPGINGGIQKREEPGDGIDNFIEIDSLDDYIKKISDVGGKIISDKISIPGVGTFTYILDTEGNKFGLMQPE